MEIVSQLLSANKTIRVLPNQYVHIKRVLHGKGALKVQKHQEVKPDDALGEAQLTGGYSSISISKKLGVSPDEGVKFLTREIGRRIFQGELLAKRSGLLGESLIKSPTDAVIESYDKVTGDLILRFLPKELPLISGVYGIIEEVDHQKGEVIIKTMATTIMGLLGSGLARSGILNIIKGRNNLVHVSQVTEQLNRQIIVAGSLIYGDALKKAAGFGVAGIVSGGINFDDFIAIEGSLDPKKKWGGDVGLSLIVTEGFGPLSIGDDIYQILEVYAGRFVFINGSESQLILPSTNADSILSLRRVSIPYNNLSQSNQLNSEEIKVGSSVRIIWPPFMGVQGKVVSVDKSATLLESGISTYLVTLETKTQKLKVPFTNLEIIG